MLSMQQHYVAFHPALCSVFTGECYISLPLTVCACFFPLISFLSFLAPLLTQMAMHLLNWYFCGAFLSAKQQTLTTPISFIHYFADCGNKAGDHVGKAN